MDHKIILKCRVCLGEFDEDSMYDLFQETAVSSDRSAKQRPLRLGEKVEYCCGVRIRESGEMPTKICMKCFDITRMWFNFRRICVNSQVYLESLCRDRKRPEGYDDGEYLEYLLEDVQTFREDARRTNAALAHSADELDSDAELSGSEYDDGEDEDYVRTEIVGSDSELKNVIKKIKKEENLDTEMDEPAEELEEKQSRGRIGWVQRNAATLRSATKSIKRDSTGTVKKSTHIGRKRGRATLPTSYMCSICGNVYTKRASFAYHMSLHSNVKPHECELCGKGFRQVCELKNHMRRHTGEKPYKCSYCDRHFIDRSEKHRHERVHTNTRPYSCNVCGKSFMYSAILKNHSKLHSGEKDYNCLVCHKAFTLQHQLKAHLQTITHKQKEAQFVSAGYEVVYE